MKRITLVLTVDDYYSSQITREVKQELAQAAVDAVVAHKLYLVSIEAKIGNVRKAKVQS